MEKYSNVYKWLTQGSSLHQAFIYSDSALNLGREANPDLDINGSPSMDQHQWITINGSQDSQLPAFDDPTVISKIAEFLPN